MRRVVVTGMGMVTPLGRDLESSWSALQEGRSGVGPISLFDAATFPTRIAAEARAFHRVFGPGGSVPVTALKGYMGNMVSGCGAVELIASLLGVNKGAIPPVLNCDEPDPECGLDLILGEPRPTANPTFLTTNLTRHGQAAALVVRGDAGAD